MNDGQEKQVTGVVTGFYPSEGAQDPHNVYIEGDRYSTFDDATVAEIEEGVKVAFTAERNGNFWNIVDRTVTVVDTDPDDTEVYGSTGSGTGDTETGEVFESARARGIRCNVALKQARELCQPLMTEDMDTEEVREVVDTICATTDRFAAKLAELNRQAAGEA